MELSFGDEEVVGEDDDRRVRREKKDGSDTYYGYMDKRILVEKMKWS